MPVDANGIRADMIMGPEARTNRMNIGGLYEHYINSASQQVVLEVRKRLGIAKGQKVNKDTIKILHQRDKALFDNVWEYIIEYYRIIAPVQAWFYDSGKIGIDGIYDNIVTIINDFVYLYLPPENGVEYLDAVAKIEEHVKPVFAPVRYTGYSGVEVQTREPVRIGSMYIMLLEKTADDWSAVASAKVQHFGFLAQIGKDKHSEAIRQQPIKGIGETEGRIVLGYCGARAGAEFMDRNNNPTSHKEMVYQLLEAPYPTRIQTIIDRNKFPFGKSKPIQMLRHLLNCVGVDLAYASEKEEKPRL